MTQNAEPITGLASIASSYDALLCDVWGVIHNGLALYNGTADALARWRESGKPVILLTNAPRPAKAVQQRLDALGLPRHCYDDILSSGDATRDMLTTRAAQNQICHFIGADKDTDLLANIALQYGDAEEADFILLTGLVDDMNETPEDYAPAMARWREKNLPLICANPDKMVRIGERLIYCAGAVAELYEQMGGEVIWLGKPHRPIYETAYKRLMRFTDCPKERILAIGDGAKTDIVGANQAGFASLFITGGLGIGEKDGGKDDGKSDDKNGGKNGANSDDESDGLHSQAEVTRFLAAHNARTNYYMKHLIW